ncbi:DUF2971 domain-containing protein [Tepidibacter hydrothermalis]|uniref:DUF2971 domain-containing protein n=1 Tax=Tepidibacter hydrothermalis TaxID=3036126 RepID=A0ABY8ECX4_9FIRM|nr:DUF2971 domain-containing protein [Tepidibacter hydrothermalis]WFD10788.1 DUF2971 domain-containing protein [Tepidibacter hydrothermalis]
MQRWKEEYAELMFFNVTEDYCEIKKRIEQAKKMKYDKMQQSLYKYCKIDEYTEWNLKNNAVWLTRADKFNDPYDSAYTIETFNVENLFKNSLLENIKKRLREEGKNIDFITMEISKLCDRSTKSIIEYSIDKYPESMLLHENIDKINEVLINQIYKEKNYRWKELNKSLQQNTFISCFSEKNNDIIMWSHYANYNKGLCIEYDFKQLGLDNYLNSLIQPVLYTDRKFDLVKSKQIKSLVNKYLAMTKFMGWAYEAEWRLIEQCPDKSILPSHTDEGISYCVPKPKAIYFGSRCSKKDQKRIMDIVDKKEILLYRMELQSNRFELKPILLE